jgi:NADPH-dependent 2,4-dienoyl-CoA reductase/sulfur reductase-like enzyme
LVDNTEELIARTPEEFQSRLGIAVRTHHEVVQIDRSRQRVAVQGNGGTRWESYDELVIATGSVPLVPAWPGVDSDGIFTVKTLADGRAIRDYIEQQHPRHAVVVGAGYIGLEMAENLRHWGIETTLLEQNGQVMPTMDADMAEFVCDALEGLGVRVHLQEEVVGFDVYRGRVQAVQTRHGSVPGDLVVLGLGVRPQTTLAQEAGIPLGVKNAIRVTPYLMTEVPHVWAVGDATQTLHQVTGLPSYVALATVANKQGRIAGMNLSGASIAFPGVLGTAITRVGSTEVARTGLTWAEASAAGIQAIETRIQAETKLGYFEDVSPMTVKIVAEIASGRILGGQIVGGSGSGKRIDTLATAVSAKMTVTQVVDLDLAYAPPFSDVWDPVQIAARTLIAKI